MKLTRAHITRYRSVEDSGEFDIDPNVTSLVGKNESGKTAGLQALYRLIPVEESAVFDEVLDFPSRLTRQRKQAGGEGIPAVSATFQLTDAEVAAIEDDLGASALASLEFTVTMGYRYDRRRFDLSLNEAAIVHHLRSQLDLALDGHPELADATTITGFLGALQAVDQPPVSVTSVIEKISSWRSQRADLYLLDEYLAPWLPKFVYFGDYDTMPGTVSIPDLIDRRNAGTLGIGEQALLSLLAEAGASLEDFLNRDKHERLIRELENTSNAITEEVFEYWSQNRELEVQLEVLPAEPGRPRPWTGTRSCRFGCATFGTGCRSRSTSGPAGSSGSSPFSPTSPAWSRPATAT